MHANTPDTLLLDHWRTRRDADAFAELVARYGPLVYSACLRVLRSSPAAEDAAQDCFLELLQSHARVHSLPGFLHTTATRRAVDRLRSERSRADREARFAAGQPITIEATWDDVSACVDEAIAALPDKLQRPIVLRFLQGRSYAEIASATGLPASTIQYQLKQGIEGIRKHLAGRGLPVSAVALSGMLAAAPSQALPATVAAHIGAMALAGGTPMTLSTTMLTFGGLFAVKSILAIVVPVGLAVLVATFLLKANPPEAVITATAPPLPVETPETQPTTTSSLPELLDVAAETLPVLDTIETTVQSMGSMAGRVVTVEGEPLADWTAMARFGDHQVQVLTDENGEFLLEGLPPGNYAVTAVHLNSGRRAELKQETIQLRAGEAITGLEAVWHTGPLSLSGYVTRDDGTPAANVMVSTYYTFESPRGQEVQRLQTMAGKDGRYTLSRFPDIKELSVNVQINEQDCFPIHRAGIVLDGHEEDFILERAPTISGWVRNAQTLKPITEYRLDHWPSRGEELPNQEAGRVESTHRQILYVHADGAFSIQARGFETLRIAVAAPGYVTGLKTLSDVKPGATLDNVEILLQPAAPIRGLVVDETGKGIAGAKIYLGYPMIASLMRSSAVSPGPGTSTAVSIQGAEGITITDDTGSFTLTEYPSALTVVSSHHEDYAPAWAELSSPSLRITLNRGATIEGSVTLNGSPPSSRQIKVGLKAGETDVIYSIVNFNGFYRLENFPAGLHTVTANLWADGYWSITREVELELGETLRLDFDFNTRDSAYLEGVVLLDDAPLETARLLAKTTLANGDQLTYWIDAQSDGSFRLGPIPAGVYEFGPLGIPARGRGTRYPEPETVTLQEGETVKHDLMYTSP